MIYLPAKQKIQKIKRLPKSPDDCAGKHSLESAQNGIRSIFLSGHSGSVTLEAAFLLPLLIISVTAFYTLFEGMLFEIRMQQALNRVSGELSLSLSAGTILAGESEDTIAEQLGISVLTTAVSVPLAQAMVIKKLGSTYSDSSLLKKKSLSFLGSYYNSADGELVLTAGYKLNIPYFSSLGAAVSVRQTVRRHVWTGISRSEDTDETYVYITRTGEVYHTALSCSYLSPSVRTAAFSLIENERNSSGACYYPCEKCGSGSGEQVYVTEYGNRYHFDRSCSAIKKDVTKIPLSQAGDRRPCSKCGSAEE